MEKENKILKHSQSIIWMNTHWVTTLYVTSSSGVHWNNSVSKYIFSLVQYALEYFYFSSPWEKSDNFPLWRSRRIILFSCWRRKIVFASCDISSRNYVRIMNFRARHNFFLYVDANQIVFIPTDSWFKSTNLCPNGTTSNSITSKFMMYSHYNIPYRSN